MLCDLGKFSHAELATKKWSVESIIHCKVGVDDLKKTEKRDALSVV